MQAEHNRTNDPSIEAGAKDEVLLTVGTAQPVPLHALGNFDVAISEVAHADDGTRFMQSVLTDIRNHVYSFFSRKPEWQRSPGTGLISAYNYAFYDSFRIAMDSFVKNDRSWP